jgi:hypothetical protein
MPNLGISLMMYNPVHLLLTTSVYITIQVGLNFMHRIKNVIIIINSELNTPSL